MNLLAKKRRRDRHDPSLPEFGQTTTDGVLATNDINTVFPASRQC